MFIKNLLNFLWLAVKTSLQTAVWILSGGKSKQRDSFIEKIREAKKKDEE